MRRSAIVLGLFVLADGMGGYNAGEVASGMATTVIVTEMQQVISKVKPYEIDPKTNKQVAPQLVRAGVLEYAIRVEEAGRVSHFPRGATGDSTWKVAVAVAGSPIVLLDIARDTQRILNPHPYRYVRFRSELVPGSMEGRRAMRVEVESFDPDPHHYAVRSFLGSIDPDPTRLQMRSQAFKGNGTSFVREGLTLHPSSSSARTSFTVASSSPVRQCVSG